MRRLVIVELPLHVDTVDRIVDASANNEFIAY
jgi:hypothetical protein